MSNLIVIQTVVKPLFVSEASGKMRFFETQQDFYHIMNQIELTSDTEIVINRGPGSYAGIRIGLSYVLGLIHGGLFANDRVKYFTTFDIINSPESNIFLKAWPRVGGIFDTAKGYFYDSKTSEVTYKMLREIPQEALIALEESDTFESPGSLKLVHLKDIFTAEKLIDFVKAGKFSEDPKPLYVNPVYISS